VTILEPLLYVPTWQYLSQSLSQNCVLVMLINSNINVTSWDFSWACQ